MLNVDDVIKEIIELKQGENDEYYDDIYIKTQKFINGNYSEEEKQKLKDTGRLGTIYLLSSFS